MLHERGGTIIPIDSKIIPLDVSLQQIFTRKNLIAVHSSHPFYDRVRELLQTVILQPTQETSPFHRIRDLIVLYTGYPTTKIVQKCTFMATKI